MMIQTFLNPVSDGLLLHINKYMDIQTQRHFTTALLNAVIHKKGPLNEENSHTCLSNWYNHRQRNVAF